MGSPPAAHGEMVLLRENTFSLYNVLFHPKQLVSVWSRLWALAGTKQSCSVGKDCSELARLMEGKASQAVPAGWQEWKGPWASASAGAEQCPAV